jgi:hypothetical protein
MDGNTTLKTWVLASKRICGIHHSGVCERYLRRRSNNTAQRYRRAWKRMKGQTNFHCWGSRSSRRPSHQLWLTKAYLHKRVQCPGTAQVSATDKGLVDAVPVQKHKVRLARDRRHIACRAWQLC